MTEPSSGTNGTSIPVVTVAQLNDRVARYRTALVALVAFVRQERGGYMSWDDQNLIRQIERLLDEDR
jgi:hypothetical protein